MVFGLGFGCVGCLSGHRSRLLVVFVVYKMTSSEIRLFADDCVCYREINTEEGTLKLQRDIDRLGSWAKKWGMGFQPVKCNMLQLTNKRSSKMQAKYTLEVTVLGVTWV